MLELQNDEDKLRGASKDRDIDCVTPSANECVVWCYKANKGKICFEIVLAIICYMRLSS
jgi:hypothetical protein